MSQRPDPTGGIVVGALFVLLGSLYLLDAVTGVSLSFRVILPTLAIVAGLALIISARFRQV
jgi:hypothetical protein